MREGLIVYILNPGFEWDNLKARQNRRRHGIAFEKAITAFDDPIQLRFVDKAHSSLQEEREILIGRIDSGVILTIVFTQRGEVSRLISARRAASKEKAAYYEYEKTHYHRS